MFKSSSFVGGFKIQLLDSKGRELQDLTPEGEWVGDRITRHEVSDDNLNMTSEDKSQF